MSSAVVDKIFLAVISDWIAMTSVAAEAAVEKIISNSGEYLSDEQQKAVSDFHDLYFADGEVNASKEAMNREVDNLVDQIQAEIDSGRDPYALSSVQESDDAKRTRLSLSGVQKQLETIVQLETGLKEKLVPVLTSMQFEDAIKQRLNRIADAWKKSIDGAPESDEDCRWIAEDIAARLGTPLERQTFYPAVLGREAPKEELETITFFDSML